MLYLSRRGHALSTQAPCSHDSWLQEGKDAQQAAHFIKNSSVLNRDVRFAPHNIV